MRTRDDLQIAESPALAPGDVADSRCQKFAPDDEAKPARSAEAMRPRSSSPGETTGRMESQPVPGTGATPASAALALVLSI